LAYHLDFAFALLAKCGTKWSATLLRKLRLTQFTLDEIVTQSSELTPGSAGLSNWLERVKFMPERQRALFFGVVTDVAESQVRNASKEMLHLSIHRCVLLPRLRVDAALSLLQQMSGSEWT
jgi:hypothetical protein